MRDRGPIVIGLGLFLALVTLPVWYNLAAGPTRARPEIARPPEGTACVAPVEEMRGGHMRLLMDWRDAVVRRGERTFVAADGRVVERSLSRTCLACHGARAEFCDRCHAAASVAITCWSCHVDPKESPPPGRRVAAGGLP